MTAPARLQGLTPEACLDLDGPEVNGRRDRAPEEEAPRETQAAGPFGLEQGEDHGDDDGDDGGIVDPPIGREATCEGCHTSEAMLKATVEPDQEPPESEGEG